MNKRKIYLAIACFDVDGGSSSSQGQTDTETAELSPVPTSSQGQHELAAPGAKVVSKFSGINFVPSLFITCDKNKTRRKKKKKREKKEKKKSHLVQLKLKM